MMRLKMLFLRDEIRLVLGDERACLPELDRVPNFEKLPSDLHLVSDRRYGVLLLKDRACAPVNEVNTSHTWDTRHGHRIKYARHWKFLTCVVPVINWHA